MHLVIVTSSRTWSPGLHRYLYTFWSWALAFYHLFFWYFSYNQVDPNGYLLFFYFLGWCCFTNCLCCKGWVWGWDFSQWSDERACFAGLHPWGQTAHGLCQQNGSHRATVQPETLWWGGEERVCVHQEDWLWDWCCTFHTCFWLEWWEHDCPISKGNAILNTLAVKT